MPNQTSTVMDQVMDQMNDLIALGLSPRKEKILTDALGYDPESSNELIQ